VKGLHVGLRCYHQVVIGGVDDEPCAITLEQQTAIVNERRSLSL
jgi:hypothetical protein